ncbi:protein eva-1 homolog B isoform 2-T2 [Liasis olivaceus]
METDGEGEMELLSSSIAAYAHIRARIPVGVRSRPVRARHSWLEKADGSSPFQSGFRPGCSTEAALVDRMDALYWERCGECHYVDFLDLSAPSSPTVQMFDSCLEEGKDWMRAKKPQLKLEKRGPLQKGSSGPGIRGVACTGQDGIPCKGAAVSLGFF